METTVTSKGQLTLPQEIRHALGIDAGTVLEVELGGKGSIVLRKKPTPGFFDQFIALRADGAPFPTGDAAREALRVAEDQESYEAAPTAKKRRATR
jgi:AbrB family looped-hinge helix DNA binding protein